MPLPTSCFHPAKLLLILGACIPSADLAAADIFVKPSAVGANDGTSWVDAFTSLQSALGVAVSGDRLWVAAGTYRPAAFGGSTSSTFQIPAGVALYGGLIGFENTLTSRNWQVNQTILSGDLAANDSGSYLSATAANRADNCQHVVTGADQATLDGVVVRGGNATGTANGGGLLTLTTNSTDSAVGMRVENCLFTDNAAAKNGGGIAAFGLATVITRCVFVDNQAGNGGGLYYAGGKSVTRCIFQNNLAKQAVAGSDGAAGGLYVDKPATATATVPVATVANALFVSNRAVYGGAVGVFSGAKPLFSYLTVINNRTVTEVVGTAISAGGGFLVDATSTAEIRNSVFDFNTLLGATLRDADVLPGGTLTYFNSHALAAGSSLSFATGNGNFSGFPSFLNAASVSGLDGLRFSADDGFMPALGASQIAKGAAISEVTVDLRGSTRNATTPDAGAYELTAVGAASQETGLTSSPLAAPAITSPTTASASVSTFFSYQIQATNMVYNLTTGYSFAISVGTPLPTGLTLNTVTGVISGTVATTGTTTVTVNATNLVGTGSASLAITVWPAIAPVITSAATASGNVGVPFSYAITGNNNPTSFTSSALPPGLRLSALTGVISGTPTGVAVLSVTLNATNPFGTSPAFTLVITINTAPRAAGGSNTGNPNGSGSSSCGIGGGAATLALVLLLTLRLVLVRPTRRRIA